MDNAFSSPAVVIGGAGQQQFIQNVGAKRILGTELLTRGKVPQFVYYLLDISSICFYANDGTDSWIGGFGYMVAGSLTQRDSLVPFEGQKFYIVETDISYEYRGGAWEGGVIAANILAPTFLTPEAPTTLARGRNYVFSVDGNYLLPANISATAGNSLKGHAIVFTLAQGTTARLLTTAADTMITSKGRNETSLDLVEGGAYHAVYNGTQWEVYASADADFLEADTVIQVGDGIVKEGSLEANDLVLSADFATEEEASDPTVANKVLAPKNVAQAVSEATRASEFNNVTGLLSRSTDEKFAITAHVDPTKLNYNAFTVVFNESPYVRDTALETLNMEAGELVLPYTTVITTVYFVLLKAGVVIQQPTIPSLDATDQMLLGAAVVLEGEVYDNIIITTPWLASADYSTRHTALHIVEGGLIVASGFVGKVNMTAIKLSRESINWVNSTTSPHIEIITKSNPITWVYLNRLGEVHIVTDEVDGERLDDNTTVGNNKYSIQVAYIGSQGNLAVLKGQIVYDNIVDAQAAVNLYSPEVPTLLGTTLEFSRWIVKGNQYPESGFTDLTAVENFQVSAGSSVAGGSVAVDAGDVTSANTDNTLVTTNLQTQINELSGRTSWEFGIDGTLTSYGNITATVTGIYTLPPLPKAGASIKVSALGEAVADFTVSGAGELIMLSSDMVTTDTVFQIEAKSSGIIYELVSDGTNWIL